ncbi:hypothetical protein QM007_06300 [Rothia sp. SD9660Na]|uniref:hypothetical protein n=1 Tax=Rothia sp. SD9660Na TaxID=3047030 RepID=UPI0024BB71D9|nr:hypothetical protein [Rothia sp. SD9660Na]WHS49542.1 hypothetical protein QM007_06300 [Rothia sp. SD9660Na]
MLCIDSRLKVFNILKTSFTSIQDLRPGRKNYRLASRWVIILLPIFSLIISLLLMFSLDKRPSLEDSFIMIFTLLATALLAVFGVISNWRQQLSKNLMKDKNLVDIIDEVVNHAIATSFMSTMGVALAVFTKLFPDDESSQALKFIGNITLSLTISIFIYVLILFSISLVQLSNSYQHMTSKIDIFNMNSNQSSSGNVARFKKKETDK